ncbi:hypothetical protein [Microbulbifer variabilis]|uniref:hypothetical protein n=1 Tax=Microbulbifer variabilis TaxID=266805 RepID=UPI00035F68E2|nr:hypothetical protein [Microbulbifer variabilis]
MRPSGKFAFPVVSALVMQGCLFLPAEEVEGEDPFFFETGTARQGESFVDAGAHHSRLRPPITAGFQCEESCEDRVYDSSSWFFPILRVY